MGNGVGTPKPKEETFSLETSPKNLGISKGGIVGVDAGPAEGKTANAGPPEGKSADTGPAEGKTNQEKTSEEKVDLMGVIRFSLSYSGHI